MQARVPFAALAALAVIAACTGRQSSKPQAGSAQVPLKDTATGESNPMKDFAGMVPGAWRRTFSSGESMTASWHWGPGQRSMRVMTQGHAGNGQPWHEVHVYYWHPEQEKVRSFGLSPFAHGVSHGTIDFDSRNATGVMDLQQFGFDPKQNGGRRKLALRWTFEGADKYHDVLLEDTGRGFEKLTEWDHTRIELPPARVAVHSGDQPLQTSEHIGTLAPFLDSTWDGNLTSQDRGEAARDPSTVRTSFEWIPYADAVYMRAETRDGTHEPIHVLDTYLYYHVGEQAIRCMAFTASGEVYEGKVVQSGTGSWQLNLQGYENGRAEKVQARVDFADKTTVLCRMWTVEGTLLKPLFDSTVRKLTN